MRRLIVVGSVSGAPGVTTMALAVAAVWPADVDGGVRPVVVEADPSGGDVMIRFRLPAIPSLLDVAATARQPHPGSLLGAASELPFGVRVVVGVPGRGPCREAVRLLASEAGQSVLLGDGRDRGTVLLDVGRITEEVEPLLTVADQVVLVACGAAESLTHVSTYGLGACTYTESLTLAVVGPCPFQAREIMQTLHVERLHFVPWDTKGVAAMHRPKPGVLRTTGFRPWLMLTATKSLARWLAGSDEARSGSQGAWTADGFHAPADTGMKTEARLPDWRHTGPVHVPGAEEFGS